MRAAPPFSGVVLCGGRSRRMGRDKALLPVGGVAMARRVAQALADAGAAEVLALGGDRAGLEAVGLDTHADAHPGAGPLPATIQALGLAAHPIVAVLGCDLVAPSAAALRRLVEVLDDHPEADVAVPVADGHHQWVHAVWRASSVGVLGAAHDAGVGSLRRAVADLTVHEVHDLPAGALADADTPADLPPDG